MVGWPNQSRARNNIWLPIHIILTTRMHVGRSIDDFISYSICIGIIEIVLQIEFRLFLFLADIDECSSILCANGQCINGVNQYTCSCDAGWTGTNCDEGKWRINTSVNTRALYSTIKGGFWIKIHIICIGIVDIVLQFEFRIYVFFLQILMSA